MWDRILEVLLFVATFALSLHEKGIKIVRFNPISLLRTVMNNRDHRKLLR